MSIWERFSYEDKVSPLPLVVLAVLSQVVGGWKAATRFSELFSPNLGFLADAVLPDFSSLALPSEDIVILIGERRSDG